MNKKELRNMKLLEATDEPVSYTHLITDWLK